jgi:hypothetical protein
MTRRSPLPAVVETTGSDGPRAACNAVRSLFEALLAAGYSFPADGDLGAGLAGPVDLEFTAAHVRLDAQVRCARDALRRGVC